MTTLSQPNPIQKLENLSALPQLPRDEGGPVFAEPWQAQAFALAVKLSEQGHFTWKEWAAALGEEEDAGAGGPQHLDEVAPSRERADDVLVALAVAAEELRLDDTLRAAVVKGIDHMQHSVPHGERRPAFRTISD